MARRGQTLKPNKARAMGRAVGIARLYYKKRSNNVFLLIKSAKAKEKTVADWFAVVFLE